MSNPIHIQTIVSMPYAENTYVVRLDGRPECLIIDPGMEPDLIDDALSRAGAVPAAILNTHGHVDHIAGNARMKAAYPDAPLVIGSGDAPMLTDPMLNLSAFGLGQPVVSPPADRTVEEGEVLDYAGITLEVLHIPGHSPGHVVFVCRQFSPIIVLGGDVLFAGGIGRTDFPGGSFDQLAKGIRNKLYTLPGDTVIYPGHGEPTTVGEERATNPFVRG
jgi:glyoxylase-like metal-dependent hydrolase (beta-lactamase superfamily II)